MNLVWFYCWVHLTARAKTPFPNDIKPKAPVIIGGLYPYVLVPQGSVPQQGSVRQPVSLVENFHVKRPA